MGELAAAALATAARDYRTLCDSTSLSAYAVQRLMPAPTVIVFSAGPAWVSGSGSRQQAHWEGHAAFIDDLTERGLLVAGGPFADESGAMNILSGSLERDDVERLYATDPFLVNGIFVLERVAPWLVFVDRWASTAALKTAAGPAGGSACAH